MEIVAGKILLIDEFKILDKKQVYVFYHRSKDINIENNGMICYCDSKDKYKAVARGFKLHFKRKETEILESFITSDDVIKTDVLHDFIVSQYRLRTRQKRVSFEKAFAQLEEIYYNEGYIKEIRREFARKIDANFGTNFESKKLPRPLVKFEKNVLEKAFIKFMGKGR